MLKLNQAPSATKAIKLRNVPADLHKAIRQAALDTDISMNSWILAALADVIASNNRALQETINRKGE